MKYGDATGWVWTQDFASPAINMYTMNAAGALMKVPLNRVPQQYAGPHIGADDGHTAGGAVLQVMAVMCSGRCSQWGLSCMHVIALISG